MNRTQLRLAAAVLRSMREEFPLSRLRFEANAVILMRADGVMIAGIAFSGLNAYPISVADEMESHNSRAISIYRRLLAQKGQNITCVC